MGIKISVLEDNGQELFFPTEMEAILAVLKSGFIYSLISNVSLVQTNSLVYTDLPGTQIQLSTGKYIIFSYLTTNNSKSSHKNFFKLTVNEVDVPNSEQEQYKGSNSLNDMRMPWFSMNEVIIPSGSDRTLSIKWRTEDGIAYSYGRYILALKVGA